MSRYSQIPSVKRLLQQIIDYFSILDKERSRGISESMFLKPKSEKIVQNNQIYYFYLDFKVKRGFLKINITITALETYP